jgi:hypothetical protein
MITKNKSITKAKIAIEIPNPSEAVNYTLISNLKMAWNIHGIAGHRDILQIAI